MRRILIVGAGQSGLQLGLGLLAHGYDVTVMTERTPDEIRAGRVTSTQIMMPSTIALEQPHGLDLWSGRVPPIPRAGFTIPGPDGTPVVNWLGDLGGAQSVDQRMKMPAWMDLFLARGGNLVVHPVAVSDIDWYTRNYDLVVVAAGKGELVSMFDRDHDRSVFTTPQRQLAVAYFHGATPRPEVGYDALHVNAIPGIGEIIMFPGLTLSGPCDIILLEAVPGGPLDVFRDVRDPDTHWAVMQGLVRQFAPWDYDRISRAELTDPMCVLSGGFSPIVRKPIAELPSGGVALGIGDVLVTNDPISGQGSNNAARAADLYLNEIVAHGDRPFDAAWMQSVFDAFWSRARHGVKFSTSLLGVPPEHVQMLMGAGNTCPAVCDAIMSAFDNPVEFEEFMYDPEKTMAFLTKVGAL
ncbi:styrene monooxygenase/indole monooxygenase family protein [Embleya scabrispora]|uniref:styrene monooxygenase/indole monooxygenase family protein n=1 Tax=Embleya scabrispora TaxID=159449 RepID=UPI00037F43AF|nr:styrene monooxygenase/indole monooxygenase family protein [Embleya scabrispora]MYS83028.1 FAD-binding oxidoreductase [Streptomyces sp. SID5474]